MSIQAVSRTDCDKFEPVRSPPAETLFEEVEWFGDDKGIVIGVITLDRSDKDWAVVVLDRDERGRFRAIDNEVSIENLDDARDLLMAKMNQALAKGETVFPQGD